jgi:ureidoglycolate hydrolase
MFRHATHTQALTPLNVDAVMAVAPAALDFSDAAHLDAIRAFALHPQDTLVLHQGTWHWGPFPVGHEPVQLLNVQGLRYTEDNDSVVLAERTGAVLEVVGA